jgi:hypothetical protein
MAEKEMKMSTKLKILEELSTVASIFVVFGFIALAAVMWPVVSGIGKARERNNNKEYT